MSVNSDPLRESIRKVAEHEGVNNNDVLLSLQVSGGSPDEAYIFSLTATGQGIVTYEYSDKMRGVETQTGQVTLEDEELANLFKSIVTSGVLDIVQSPASFIPDTTVGRLEISNGSETYTTYFAAEMDQAEAQDLIPPPELIEVVEAIYRLGADIIGMQTIKP